jgi:DNA polymerase-3 subunit gamma/tau
MFNLVLYRKYRPKTFSEVIGQEHIVQTLTNAISSGMVSHAYLFFGPRGSGKTTLARLLAKAVNCQNRKEKLVEPCNQCSSCLEIIQGNSIDLIEIDAASNRGIDEIREVRDGIRFVPTKSKYKVFIIDESHQLTKEAANALLKTLEEPPAHAIFILATTEIHKMIPTIISRCQRFDFRKLTIPEIIKRLEIILEKENVKVEKEALELIALNSSGSIRDAESLLDQVLSFGGKSKEDIKNLLGLVEIKSISQFCDLVITKKTSEAINLLNKIYKQGSDLQEFAKGLINYLRQGLILKIIGTEVIIEGGLGKEEIEKLQKQIASLKEEKLKKIINLFLEAENKIKYSSIPQLPLELAIIEACGIA